MIFLNKVINRFFTRPLLKSRLNRCGTNFRIGYSSNLECPESFSIADNFFSGPYSYLSSNKETPVIIGSNVMLGPDCKIIGGNHNTSWPDGPMMKAPYLGGGKGIVIEDDVWVGAGSIILDGAKLSEGVVVAAGAVVTCITEPYSVYAGVPARKIKFRFSGNELAKIRSERYTEEELLKAFNGMSL